MAAAMILRVRGRLTGTATKFGREEEGSLLIFGLFCFVMMLLVCGLAIDLMRFEERRTTLMNTIDRAALAAADLQQTLTPQDVVKDYFTKAGLVPPSDSQIRVTKNANNTFRRVEILSGKSMETMFIHTMGIKTLNVGAASTAEESIGQIEVSLVLDVSGSMSGSKLTSLKPAASSFVDKIFSSAEVGKVSMSLVVYDNQVSAGAPLLNYLDVTNEHNLSNCIEFDSADYSSTALRVKTGAPYQRNAHFDRITTNSGTAGLPDPHCSIAAAATVSEATRAIIPFSDNPTTLKTRINALTAGGNTSIDLGAKWGVALLDPAMKPVVTGMIAAGQLPSAFSERPYAYGGTGDQKSLKIMVIMTDGENTDEYELKPPYTSSSSSVLYRINNAASTSTSTSNYSIYDSATNKYYAFATNPSTGSAYGWRSTPWGGGSAGAEKSGGVNIGATAVPWKDVYQTFNVYYFAGMMGTAYNSTTVRNTWRSTPVNTLNGTAKDTQAKAICSAAKAKGKDIVIYTIAFQAATAGQTLLKACASSDANYYSISNLDINKAFSGIVNSINKLRLTH